ncbi:MAG: hypothetical protein QNJ40_05420 [Xanthomonadales bacterium]|nr:hypothetical protein [Xanthomonadales bacterium]
MRFINLLLTLILTGSTFSAIAQTAFTYQGSLVANGEVAQGSFDFRCDLFDDPEFGLMLGTVSISQVAVTEGVFTAELDFGNADLFRGGPLYLEIRVGQGGQGASTVLAPRQLLTPAPLAISAQFAEQAVLTQAGAVNSLSIVDGSIVIGDVDSTSIQGRVAGSCAGGETIAAINEDGSVVCSAPPQLETGEGLTLSANTLSVDFAGDGAATSASRSDHRHDALYGIGPLQININATGTAEENGTALKNAVAGISDAAADRPYLLALSPGVFEVGAEGLALKDFVSLRGAGEESTVITGPGQPQNFLVDNAVLRMASDLTVENLKIRCTGGIITEAYAVLGLGARWKLRDAAIEVQRNGASASTGFAGGVTPSPQEHSGSLQRLRISVDGGYGIGLGSGAGNLDFLELQGVHILVSGDGVGIGDAGADSNNARLIVTDTRVELSAGGRGIAGYGEFDEGRFEQVTVEVSGGGSANFGLRGAGSGFRPLLINSRVSVNGGTDPVGIRINNGRVTLSGSHIEAATGLRGNATGTLVGSFFLRHSVINASTAIELVSSTTGHRVEVDHSVIDAFRIIRTETTSGQSIARFGNSKLDASGGTLIDITSGLVDAVCTGSYDRNYQQVSATCDL